MRVEPEAEDDILKMWEWICGIHAGRMQDAPEEIRQAAQQAGFTFDAFASAEEEAARLADYLDRHAAITTEPEPEPEPLMTRLEMEGWGKDIACGWGSSPEVLARAKAAAKAHLNLTIPDDATEMMTATLIGRRAGGQAAMSVISPARPPAWHHRPPGEQSGHRDRGCSRT